MECVVHPGSQGTPTQVSMNCSHTSPSPSNPPGKAGNSFYGALKLLSFNMNGMFKRISCGSKKVPKYKVLGTVLKSHNIQIAGIQEHCISTASQEKKISKYFNAIGYHCIFNLNLHGRGGTCLIWQHCWNCPDSFSIDCRILISA